MCSVSAAGLPALPSQPEDENESAAALAAIPAPRAITLPVTLGAAADAASVAWFPGSPLKSQAAMTAACVTAVETPMAPIKGNAHLNMLMTSPAPKGLDSTNQGTTPSCTAYQKNPTNTTTPNAD